MDCSRIIHYRASYEAVWDRKGPLHFRGRKNVLTNGEHYNRITVYSRLANGNVSPIRTISGASTGLNGPRGVAICK